jgi:SAM-dependent methyltransferase
MQNESDKAKHYWSFLADKKRMADRNKTDMSGLSLMHDFHNRLVTGDPHTHYLRHFADRYLGDAAPDIASLGSGSGHLERILAGDASIRFNYRSIDGYELNPELVRFAAREATGLGLRNVRYFEMDLNRLVLDNERYDLVIFFHSLHHVAQLEHCLDRVSDGLRDGGLLLVIDFVGPTRFQWTDKQVRYAQALLDLLPDELKINLAAAGAAPELKTVIGRPTVEQVAAADPSEAVRSSEIMPLLRDRFKVLEEKPLGGTILGLLFSGIAGNFDENDPHVRSLILSFQCLEEALITEAVLSADYVFAVAAKRRPGRAEPVNKNETVGSRV